MRKSHILTYAWLTAILLLFTSLTGCRHHQTPYPAELLQVDSLIQKGRYGKADTLFTQYLKESDRSKVNEHTKMYERLLQMGLKSKTHVPLTDLLEAEYLCDYYKSKDDKQMYARAMFYVATTYMDTKEMEKAEEYFLKTLKLAKEAGLVQLQTWVYRQVCGILFFHDKDDEAYKYAWLHYRSAKASNDTMQMILGSNMVATYYTAQNNADSTIYYYKEAIRLSEAFGDTIELQYSSSSLCDIYLQLNRLDDARSLIDHSRRGLANKGLLFKRTGQLDSANHYYRLFLEGATSHYSRTEGLKALADIAHEQGKKEQEAEYLRQLSQLKDSTNKANQTKELKLVLARHDDAQTLERNEIQKKRLWTALITLFIVVLALLGILTGKVHNMTERQRKKKEKTDSQPVLQGIKDKAHGEVQREAAGEAQDETEPTGMELLEQSRLYRQLKIRSGQPDFTLTGEQWEELGTMIDGAYDGFTQKLFAQHNLSDIELRVCYLVKLGVPLTDVANMLNRSRAAITQLRSRLYEKLTGSPGTSSDLDKLLKDL